MHCAGVHLSVCPSVCPIFFPNIDTVRRLTNHRVAMARILHYDLRDEDQHRLVSVNSGLYLVIHEYEYSCLSPTAEIRRGKKEEEERNRTKI